eukprot:5750717-Amphidinium_carterae.1
MTNATEWNSSTNEPDKNHQSYSLRIIKATHYWVSSNGFQWYHSPGAPSRNTPLKTITPGRLHPGKHIWYPIG